MINIEVVAARVSQHAMRISVLHEGDVVLPMTEYSSTGKACGAIACVLRQLVDENGDVEFRDKEFKNFCREKGIRVPAHTCGLATPDVPLTPEEFADPLEKICNVRDEINRLRKKVGEPEIDWNPYS